MTKCVLVAYATGSGSTAAVAEAIGEELRSENVAVDVRHVKEVIDLSGYSAVVLGSSIRVGRWLPDAVRFLEANASALTTVPVAYFTTCLTLVEDSEKSRQRVLSYMEPVLQLVPAVDPVGLGLFAGSLSPNMQNIVPGGGPFGDFRDWDAIRSWARKIRPLILETESRAGAPVVLSRSILSFTNMSGADLRQMDLRESELRHSRLVEAKLAGTNLQKADLTGADLRRADLREARLSWADFNGSDLRGADLRDANLMGTELKGANLRKANLKRAVLNGANLSKADLKQANLKGADLNWADLSKAKLGRANLSRANLGWANLSEAKLMKCKLTGALYNQYTQWPESFSPEKAGCIFVPRPH